MGKRSLRCHPNKDTPARSCRQGMPERRLLLLLADPLGCSPRNARPGSIHLDASSQTTVPLPCTAYTGDSVSERSFIALLTGGAGVLLVDPMGAFSCSSGRACFAAGFAGSQQNSWVELEQAMGDFH